MARLFGFVPGAKSEGATMAATNSTNTWVVDSGSCFDIVGKTALSFEERRNIRTDDQRAVTMQTANGIVTENRRISVNVRNLDRPVDAVVLDKSPNVLSLGKLCLRDGFSFHWEAGQQPVLVMPDGRRKVLALDWLVPVLPIVGQTESSCASAETEELRMPAAETKKDEAIQPGGTQAKVIDADHCLTHFPKMSWCETCQLSKAQRVSCRRQKGARRDEDEIPLNKPQAFGDLITADHAVMRNEDERSTRGDLSTLVILDMFTR